MRKNYKYSDMELSKIQTVCKRYESKLIELMGHDAFMVFSKEIAKDLFFASVNEIKDPDFRNFCLDNFDRFTSNLGNAALDFPNSKREEE